MFGIYTGHNQYELLTSQGKDPLASWLCSGAISRGFDSASKGFILNIPEGSNRRTFIEYPKTSSNIPFVSDCHGYVVIQVLPIPKRDFSIDIGVSIGTSRSTSIDTSRLSKSSSSNRLRRGRIVLSNAFRSPAAHDVHAQIPIPCHKEGFWLNLCLDMAHICHGAFGELPRSINSIRVNGVCSLRRIILCKMCPPLNEDFSAKGATEQFWPLQGSLQFPGSVPSWSIRVGFGENKSVPGKFEKQSRQEVAPSDGIKKEVRGEVEISRKSETGSRLLKLNGILYDPENNTYFTN